VVTIILFAISNLLPPQQRALMYVHGGNPETPPSASDNRIKTIIKQHGLDAPLPLQYIHWVRFGLAARVGGRRGQLAGSQRRLGERKQHCQGDQK
jgi:ABC-type dipeptide/oligopeptide/nickel transport system permease component